MDVHASQPKLAGITLNALKYIAIVAMTIDHIAFAFVPAGTPLYIMMRFIGRLTAPIMFFAAVEGCKATRNINRYMLRLAVFAAVSWVPFLYFYYGGDLTAGSPLKPNVIFTILLGVAAVRVRRSDNIPSLGLKIAIIAGLVALSIPADWGVIGVIIILTLDRFRVSFSVQMCAYSVVAILGLDIVELFSQPILALAQHGTISISSGVWVTALINTGALLPIDLFSYYKGQHGSKTRFSKWFFYIYYPAHLIVLGALQAIF